MNVGLLGSHLRAHQQLNVICMKFSQGPLNVVAALDCIAVQPSNTRLGKGGVQMLLDLFRTCSQEKDMLTLTSRTAFGNGLPVSAVMAFHAISSFVKGQGNTAILALELLPAGPA